MPERIMNRMPVPVHDAVRTGGKMAVSLLAELALMASILEIPVPRFP